MSATVPKYNLYAVQNVARNGGLYGVLADPRCCEVPVEADCPLFPTVQPTGDLSERIREEGLGVLGPYADSLRTAANTGPGLAGQIIAGTSGKSFYGNQAAYSLAHRILSDQTGLNFQASATFKHAERTEDTVFAFLCPGSNLNPAEACKSFKEVKGERKHHLGEFASDYISALGNKTQRRHVRKAQNWLTRFFSRRETRKHLQTCSDPADVWSKDFSVSGKAINLAQVVDSKLSEIQVFDSSTKDRRVHQKYSRIYSSGSALYWVIRNRESQDAPSKWARAFRQKRNRPERYLDDSGPPLIDKIRSKIISGIDSRGASKPGTAQKFRKKGAPTDEGLFGRGHARSSECYVLYDRDRRDLKYLLTAYDNLLTHIRGRLLDLEFTPVREKVAAIYKAIVSKWMEFLKVAGQSFRASNDMGAALDQVVWICLAELAGSKYFDHPSIMWEKAERKTPDYLSLIRSMVSLYQSLPVDLMVDMFGLNKLALYPQVCAYGMVSTQLDLHTDPLDCKFEKGSKMDVLREGKKLYERYLYTRLMFKSYGYYPGVIKPDVEPKSWHQYYRVRGIPADNWRESTDVDLTGTLAHAPPDWDTYLSQADSSCAPSSTKAYASMDTYRSAPSHEKRKLLYLLQCPNLPDLRPAHEKLMRDGEILAGQEPEEYKPDLGFSIDVSTGARFERQKNAARPFYQLCSPFACIVSSLELTVRSFLNQVPQSLMSMSRALRNDACERINQIEGDLRKRFFVSDDKEKYSPKQDPDSQADTADFFSEITGDHSFSSVTRILLSNNLYYRIHGHLVSYPSNGTDREGMRGAINTWSEVVLHAYHTRLLREHGELDERTSFLGFIDDALRRYKKKADDGEADVETVRMIVSHLEDTLRCCGRKMSWDKAYVSEYLSTILGEVYYMGIPMANGLKALVGFCDVEEKLVEDLSSLEANFASKASAVITAGGNDISAFYCYLHNTLKTHRRFGVKVDERMSEDEYAVWCIAPIALGGASVRSMIEMKNTESGGRTAASIGNIVRLASIEPGFNEQLNYLLEGPFDEVSDMDFLRDPTQFHVSGPRIRTQRVPNAVREILPTLCTSEYMKEVLNEVRFDEERLLLFAKEMRSRSTVDVQEVKEYYSGSASSTLDSIVTKVCMSDTVKSLLSGSTVAKLRTAVRRDAVACSLEFRYRLYGSRSTWR